LFDLLFLNLHILLIIAVLFELLNLRLYLIDMLL
jgi:hypothetical protein